MEIGDITKEDIAEFLKSRAVLLELAEMKLDQGMPPSLLFHYTGAGSAMKIIQSDEIHGSHARFMNDSTELDYGAQLYKEVMEGPHEIADREQFLRFRDFLPTSKEVLTATPVYFSCFSEDGNDLSQWRAYGNRGTCYALGFDAADLEGCRYLGHTLSYSKVVYDRSKQQERIRDLAYSVFNLIESARSAGIQYSEKELKIVWFEFVDWLQTILIGMKRSDFRHEREWRLVYRNIAGIEKTNPQFRTSETGIVIPYCPFKPSGRLPLKVVTVGPTPNAQIAALGFHKFLESQNHKGIDVIPCKIPLRAL